MSLENGRELSEFMRASEFIRRSSNDDDHKRETETETEQLAGCSSDMKDPSPHARMQLVKITINNAVIL